MANTDISEAEQEQAEVMAECVSSTRDVAALKKKEEELSHELECLRHHLQDECGMLQNARNRLQRCAERVIDNKAGV